MNRCADSPPPQRQSADPIVITGIGLVTPLGATREATWQGVRAGRSAARRLTMLDLGEFDADQSAAWVGCPAVPYGSDEDGFDPVSRLALTVAREAADDARFKDAAPPERRGCVFGTSKGSLHAATAIWRDTRDANWSEVWPSSALQRVCAALNIRGPGLAPVAACATGLVAVIRAVQLLEAGDCDLVMAGSADDSLHPLVLASFQRLGVLARGAEPARLSRPFDRARTGFVIGAGAGALVLERRSHALRRGVDWYAEWGDGRLSADPHGFTTLSPDGAPLRALLDRVWPAATPPDYLQLHGTGTRLNDVVESRTVAALWEERLRESRCGSAKGALGHLLGAAGSVEFGLVCLALRDQIVPPNVNLDDPDPQCALPFTGRTAEPRSLLTALKVSLGFGGHQAAAWLKRGTREP